tara:strand:+ start:944 stop:2056 length:1113 start_codon:yes stop_codon:yes gene_type:complete
MKERNILIIAGETSADIHGSKLVLALKSMDDDLHFFGIGGKKLKETGVEIIQDNNKMSIVGFVEVLKHYFFFKEIFKNIINYCKVKKPIRAILIDYPGFNLRLAKELKKLNIPISYYISPQVWAWKENRVKIIKDCVDQMLCIFPFEKNWYQQRGVKAKYVGHPFSQLKIVDNNSRLEFYKKHQIDPSAKILALMPGSRQIEVNRHLKTMLEAAKIICKKNNVVAVIGLASDISLPKIGNDFIKIEKDNPINALKNSHVSILSSGTISLEAGFYGIPSIVIYKMNLISWLIAKSLVKVKYVSMTNILLEREIFKEYLQNEINSESIAEQILKFINNNKNETLDHLKELKKIIGKKKPNVEAAKIILGAIN